MAELMRHTQKENLGLIDVQGNIIGQETIPPQFITVLATGILNRGAKRNIEEIPLNEAYRRLLEN